MLDRLLEDARAGRSRALVLRGEAGVGKSALLDHLLAGASGWRIVRIAGVESEMELVFAGLHQLCAPLLDLLDRLPAVQADALRAAFGMTDGVAPDRFLVGLAVLSLLSDISGREPVVCVVDDAHWLDRVSMQTLAFVARRLLAERVALVFAVREPSDDDELAGLPELWVTGLGFRTPNHSRVASSSGSCGASTICRRTRDGCCWSPPPSAWSNTTPRRRGRPTWRRCGRRSSPAGSTTAAGSGRSSRPMRDTPPPANAPRAIDLLLDGLAARVSEGYDASVQPLRRALDAFGRAARPGDDDMRWLWLACPVAPEPIAPDLWDDETWHELTTRAVRLAREAGALHVLPAALTSRATVDLHAGEFEAASDLIQEAAAITRVTGGTSLPYPSLLLTGYRGHERDATESIGAGLREAVARGEGRAVGLAEHAMAVLHTGLGHYDTALAAALRACEHDDLGFYGWSLTEIVEAGARAGDRDAASRALDALAARTRACGTGWPSGSRPARAPCWPGTRPPGALYQEAIDRLGRTRMAVHVARAQLVYGEWLRRQHRRTNARAQLRAAHERFAGMGAEAFAERARRELLATGDTVRARTFEARDQLTAQEAQIARLAADRHTNPEIGAALFISPRTVEYHLRKVFTKLDISSRRELRAALDDDGPGRARPGPHVAG